MRAAAIIAAILTFASAAIAGDLKPREGWSVTQTTKPHKQLVDDLKTAVKANGMAVVTQAGPTGAAAKRGINIPGNRVIGVFNNDFAVRALETSTAAMVEAPMRFYVTENSDGTATLSYKIPSVVWSAYADEGGEALAAIGVELDKKFAAIAAAAIQ